MHHLSIYHLSITHYLSYLSMFIRIPSSISIHNLSISIIYHLSSICHHPSIMHYQKSIQHIQSSQGTISEYLYDFNRREYLAKARIIFMSLDKMHRCCFCLCSSWKNYDVRVIRINRSEIEASANRKATYINIYIN